MNQLSAYVVGGIKHGAIWHTYGDNFEDVVRIPIIESMYVDNYPNENHEIKDTIDVNFENYILKTWVDGRNEVKVYFYLSTKLSDEFLIELIKTMGIGYMNVDS